MKAAVWELPLPVLSEGRAKVAQRYVLCVSPSKLSISVVLEGELTVGDLRLVKQMVI